MTSGDKARLRFLTQLLEGKRNNYYSQNTQRPSLSEKGEVNQNGKLGRAKGRNKGNEELSLNESPRCLSKFGRKMKEPRSDQGNPERGRCSQSIYLFEMLAIPRIPDVPLFKYMYKRHIAVSKQTGLLDELLLYLSFMIKLKNSVG